MMDLETRLNQIETARVGILDTFIENKIQPDEAMTCLTGLLIQVFKGMVRNNDRETFLHIMGQCFDAHDDVMTGETLQ